MTNGDTRRVLTTRRDASMVFEFSAFGGVFKFQLGFRTMPVPA